MFILSRILSSGSNVPEPCKLNAIPEMSYKYGSALIVSDGMAFNASEGDMPTHICGESIDVGPNGPKTITCYPITSDMIFETTVNGDPSELYTGCKVKISNPNGAASGVSNVTSGGFVTIFNLNGAAKSGDKIYVRFN